MELKKIIESINLIEERNDQSIMFTLHGDGSGSFEDFWSEKRVISFNSLDELELILNSQPSSESVTLGTNEQTKEIFICDCVLDHYDCDCIEYMICDECGGKLRAK